jgi:hypothetical protein
MKSKSFHASDSALDSPRHQDDESSTLNHPNRPYSSTRRPALNSRHHPAKSTSSYFKSSDKNNSSSNTHSRYVLFLDKTRIPIFYDVHNNRVPFTTTDVELWLRRLRILYQIDKGRNYGEVIENILSILQFIPATLLCTLTHITMETYSIDEMMLNDIARARMYMLEEWTSDGDPYRLVSLTNSYRTMAPNVLATTGQQLPTTSINLINDEHNPFQQTLITSSDLDATVVSFQFNTDDSD